MCPKMIRIVWRQGSSDGNLIGPMLISVVASEDGKERLRRSRSRNLAWC